ncbi:hypothetical protein [Sphingobacterium multivorum]|uniref:hypothetical protein n=1 Tax=Sphingobacterium multivorum TaxID=28454 RepID=UPI00345E45DE
MANQLIALILKEYYYDIERLEADDLPPNSYTLGKTLGSTDGFGNEVLFHFTTTLAPEWDFMDAQTNSTVSRISTTLHSHSISVECT